jgi:hypothetical protein
MVDKDSGGWIFVSHANADLKAVRQVRNMLEERGFNPILFFLKTVLGKDELPDLLKREIRARNFFLFCDSPAAAKSDWVTKEREMVASMPEKAVEKIAVDRPLEPQYPDVIKLLNRATVFLSYSSADTKIAHRIAAGLRKNDFRTLTYLTIKPGAGWSSGIHDMIDAAVEEGFVILLVTANWLRSLSGRQELMIALAKAAALKKSNVVPVILDDYPPQMAGMFSKLQSIDMRGDLDAGIQRLTDSLLSRQMQD